MKKAFHKNSKLKIILPIVTLAGAMVLFAGLRALRPEPERAEPRRILPRVDYVVVQAGTTQLTIPSQGTVSARTRTQLTARVSGVIVSKGAAWRDGGSFSRGDVLLQIDPVPYRASLADARAALAAARLALAQEEANAAQAVADWEALGNGQPALPLTLRQPQLEMAEAQVAAAEGRLAQAEQNLDFTTVRAPYDGRIIRTVADAGQSVTAHASLLGEIYAAEAVEVALPVDMEQFRVLRGALLKAQPPEVALLARFGEETASWTGRLERLGSVVSESSRLGTAIAVVQDPDNGDNGLLPGMFVEASIHAGSLRDSLRIPRAALQPDGSVLRISEATTLHRVHPRILWRNAEEVVVEDGLAAGDRICITPLLFFVEGMSVELAEKRFSDNREGDEQ